MENQAYEPSRFRVVGERGGRRDERAAPHTGSPARAALAAAVSAPRSTAVLRSGSPTHSGYPTTSSATAPPAAAVVRCDCWSAPRPPHARTSTTIPPPPTTRGTSPLS